MTPVIERYHAIRREVFAAAPDPKTATVEQLTRSHWKPSNDAASVIAALLVVAEALRAPPE